MVSFATSLAMVENRIFIGNGNIISLILQDEILHKDWTAWIINQVVKEDPRFAQARIDCEEEVYALYADVIREEKGWADYLFNRGPVIGLNANILKDFVDFTAVSALKDIGIKYRSTALNMWIPVRNRLLCKKQKAQIMYSELCQMLLITRNYQIYKENKK
jgi:ribonucleoside-diphosphate reductase beta chain